MKNLRRILMSLAVLACTIVAVPAMAAEQQVQVGRGTGLLFVPPGAAVGVVLVSGAGGMSPNDLLMRSRHLFRGQGIATLMIGFDNSPLRAVEFLRQYVPRVGIVGMSAGTLTSARAVANGARPDSLVLISGFLSPGPAQNSVSAIVGSPAALPRTLVIHNRQEECDKTPASGVAPFVAWSRGRAQAVWVESVSTGRDPCGPLNYHGFPGSEPTVVQTIARFVSGR